MSDPSRTLESFSKQDLIKFIKQMPAWCILGEQERVVRALATIERDRKFKELGAKMDALEAEISKCNLPQDWPIYKDLSDKWNAANRAWDRIYKGSE